MVTPLIGFYFRFMQHEPWGIVVAAMVVVAGIFIFAAVWGSRMTGKAIVLSEEGISLPRLLSGEPETIPWTGIEACSTSFNRTTSGGPERFIELTYYGGQRRKIMMADVSNPEALERAIREALEKLKQ